MGVDLPQRRRLGGVGVVRTRRVEARGVHERVQPAEAGAHPLRQRTDARVAREIGDPRLRASSGALGFACDLGERDAIAAHQRDGSSLRRVGEGDRASDAAAGSGDQGRAAVERSLHAGMLGQLRGPRGSCPPGSRRRRGRGCRRAPRRCFPRSTGRRARRHRSRAGRWRSGSGRSARGSRPARR